MEVSDKTTSLVRVIMFASLDVLRLWFIIIIFLFKNDTRNLSSTVSRGAQAPKPPKAAHKQERFRGMGREVKRRQGSY